MEIERDDIYSHVTERPVFALWFLFMRMHKAHHFDLKARITFAVSFSQFGRSAKHFRVIGFAAAIGSLIA